MNQPLFCTEPLRQRVIESARGGQPTACAILEQARDLLGPRPIEPPAGNASLLWIDATAILHLIEPQRTRVTHAVERFIETVRPWTHAQLTLAHWALGGSVLVDATLEAMTPGQRSEMLKVMSRLVDGQKEVEFHQGNPHVVTNNHWAVSHAGAALAALSCLRQADDRHQRDLHWAMARVRAFLHHHGPAGLYHEGPGYALYPACYWLPLLVAARHAAGIDLAETFRFVQDMGASFYAMACPRPKLSDTPAPADGVGMKLSWNDDGPGWTNANPAVLLIHEAKPAHRAALRTFYDRMNGIDGDRRFCPEFLGLFFSFLFYPYDTTPADPEPVLPKYLCDTRQGLGVLRNTYRDADDAIVGFYARTTFVGGHCQDDAGSIRMMAFGHDWITGGGQNRPAARWQSVVCPAEDDPDRPNPPGCGAILAEHPTPTGGAIAIELRKVSHGYHERLLGVDFDLPATHALRLAVLDLIDDHLSRRWSWNMTFGTDLAATLDPDRRGFVLQAPTGATLTARFLADPPDTLELTSTPTSRRTFQSGVSVDYISRPVIRATFATREHQAIYVVMTVRRGGRARIERPGESPACAVDARDWSDPFGPLIDPKFVPGRAGVTSRYPAGVKGFRTAGFHSI